MLVRTRPLHSSFDQRFDRAFAQLTNSFFTPTRRTPVVDAAWRDGSLELTVDLPGVATDAIDVAVSGGTLTVSVRTDDLVWERSLRLADALDPEQVSAQHVHGRLTVVVAGRDAPVRKIEIDTVASRPEVAPATDDTELQPEGDTSSTD